MEKIPLTIFWFRRDLRLEDNTALNAALKNSKAVLPIFIFDSTILNKLEDKKDRRVDFIHQVLTFINSELHKYGSTLSVFIGQPLDIIKELERKFSIESVITNHDYEPYAIQRDQTIAAYLKTKKILFQSYKDQVIFEKNEICKADGTPYTIFTPYSKIWKVNYRTLNTSNNQDKKLYSNFHKLAPVSVPSLNKIGFEKTDMYFTQPELDKKIIRSYDEFRNIPSVKGTTGLSVHLRFGTISIRKAAAFAVLHNEQWLNELIWREFFMQILFHFPYVQNQSFKKKYDGIQWQNDEKEFQRWCEGNTGYPIVDAGMRELNTTGFMHNRVRMTVASFLCKHLLIDWRWGESYFANKLNDFELSANNGNWQWAAGCGCDAAPYFRVFNPDEQTKRFDPDFIYIRKWVPEFEELSYPRPMVDHKLARERALSVYKKALQNGSF